MSKLWFCLSYFYVLPSCLFCMFCCLSFPPVLLSITPSGSSYLFFLLSVLPSAGSSYLSFLPVIAACPCCQFYLHGCSFGLSPCLSFLPVLPASSSCLSFLPVLLACSSCLFFLPILPVCPSCLFFLPILPACPSCLFFLPIHPACSSFLFFLPILPACSSCLFFWPFSLPVLLAFSSCLYFLSVLPACSSCLFFLPILPVCPSCLYFLSVLPACFSCLYFLPVLFCVAFLSVFPVCPSCLFFLPILHACPFCLFFLPILPACPFCLAFLSVLLHGPEPALHYLCVWSYCSIQGGYRIGTVSQMIAEGCVFQGDQNLLPKKRFFCHTAKSTPLRMFLCLTIWFLCAICLSPTKPFCLPIMKLKQRRIKNNIVSYVVSHSFLPTPLEGCVGP